MKNNLHLLIASLLMMVAFNANSQNHETLGEGHLTQIKKKTANIVIDKRGDNVTTTYYKTKTKAIKANAETHLLSITPIGDYSYIHVYGSDYDNAVYYQPFEEQLEEGVYNVFLQIWDGVICCYLAYEINLNQDATMTPSADEACYTVTVVPRDENGQPISDYTILYHYPEILIEHGSDNTQWCSFLNDYSEEWPIRFNHLTASNTLSAIQSINVDGQTTFFMVYPFHTGQLECNWELSNDPSETKTYLTRFNMHSDNCFYKVDYFRFYVSELDGFYIPSCTIQGEMDDVNAFDPSEPIRLVTNNNVNDPTIYYNNGYNAAKPFVTAFEKFDVGGMEYYDKISTTPVFYTENKWVNEPFDAMPFTAFSMRGLEYFDPLTQTPAVNHTDFGQIINIGKRTPILYWQAENYNSSTSFWGQTYIAGPMEFIGDNGCIRKGDECANMTINAGGEEVFNDSVYKFNYEYYNFPFDEPCAVTMEIKDNHLVDNGVVKANHTNIAFDLNRDDAMPPSLTILQVMNENGNETIELPNYANSQINFAAGDFAPHVFVFGWYDKMQYVGKPSIEVYYSTEGKDWTSLNYTEEEAMFHVNYGNFFTIDLAQLDNSVINQWVNLKFVVTDDAGNSQTQELSNVFFAGQMTSIAEHTASPHTVYPNPFNNEVRVKASQAINGEVNISVYNVLGKQVYAKNVTCSDTSEFVIDGSNLPSGIYFYSIATETGMLQGRIVKE